MSEEETQQERRLRESMEFYEQGFKAAVIGNFRMGAGLPREYCHGHNDGKKALQEALGRAKTVFVNAR